MKHTIEEIEAAYNGLMRQKMMLDDDFDWSGYQVIFDGKHLNVFIDTLTQDLAIAKARGE